MLRHGLRVEFLPDDSGASGRLDAYGDRVGVQYRDFYARCLGRLGGQHAFAVGSQVSGGDRQHPVLRRIPDLRGGASAGLDTAVLSGLRRDRRRGYRAGIRHAGRHGRQVVPRSQGTGHRDRGYGLRRRRLPAEQGTGAVFDRNHAGHASARLHLARDHIRYHSAALQLGPQRSPPQPRAPRAVQPTMRWNTGNRTLPSRISRQPSS